MSNEEQQQQSTLNPESPEFTPTFSDSTPQPETLIEAEPTSSSSSESGEETESEGESGEEEEEEEEEEQPPSSVPTNETREVTSNKTSLETEHPPQDIDQHAQGDTSSHSAAAAGTEENHHKEETTNYAQGDNKHVETTNGDVQGDTANSNNTEAEETKNLERTNNYLAEILKATDEQQPAPTSPGLPDDTEEPLYDDETLEATTGEINLDDTVPLSPMPPPPLDLTMEEEGEEGDTTFERSNVPGEARQQTFVMDFLEKMRSSTGEEDFASGNDQQQQELEENQREQDENEIPAETPMVASSSSVPEEVVAAPPPPLEVDESIFKRPSSPPVQDEQLPAQPPVVAQEEEVEVIQIPETSVSSPPPANKQAPLPDVVTQTQHISPSQQELTEQVLLPPLPPSSLALEQTQDEEEKKVEAGAPLLTSTQQTQEAEEEDLLGNKSLLKKVIKGGQIDSRPSRSSLCTVTYRLFVLLPPDNDGDVSDDEGGKQVDSSPSFEFFAGESEVLPAMDMCVQLMNKGEHALITADSRHGYGQLGWPDKNVPPNARLRLDLTLVNWVPAPNIELMTGQERLKWGDKKRDAGNFYYRRNEYSSALTCYRGALQFLNTDENALRPGEETSVVSQLNERFIAVQNNVGQTNLQLAKYEECLAAVDEVLKRDPRNVKGLFRRGKALFELGRFDECLHTLRTLSTIESADMTASTKNTTSDMMRVCETKMARYEKSEKEIYKRMFSQPLAASASASANTTGGTGAASSAKTSANNTNRENNNNSWWMYFAMGTFGTVLAVAGIAAFIRYRKVL